MARQNRKTELLSHVRSIAVIKPATTNPAATTLTAVPAAGAVTLTVASITGIGVGDTLIVGRGEKKEIVKVHASTAPAGNTVTLDDQTPIVHGDHLSADPVVRAQILDLAAIHADGVNLSVSGDPIDVAAENQHFVSAQKGGQQEMMLDFGLNATIPDNICAALGMLDSRISGAGSAGDPRELYLDLTDQDGAFQEETDLCWRFTGLRKDRTVVSWDAFACEADPTNFSLELGRTTVTKLPVRLKVTGGLLPRTGL